MCFGIITVTKTIVFIVRHLYFLGTSSQLQQFSILFLNIQKKEAFLLRRTQNNLESISQKGANEEPKTSISIMFVGKH